MGGKSGGSALASYRIYHVGTGGSLRVGETFVAKDDDEAVARARAALSPGAPAELWEGGRIVGRFTSAHGFSPGSG
jgi:hypothetical protein